MSDVYKNTKLKKEVHADLKVLSATKGISLSDCVKIGIEAIKYNDAKAKLEEGRI